MTIAAPHYPIIYVRGYAATMSAIEETVATPYMGFNLGATKIRQNYDDEIVRFIFESPLIRLMKDEGYSDSYKDGDFINGRERAPAKSVWIFRYYESASEDLGEGERRSIPRFAADLRAFILRVRDQICGDDAAARAAFKVYLVAHSMGGLICRCYLQNICRRGAEDAFEAAEVAARNQKLELKTGPVDPLVDKVFTYATPHNGIELLGINVPDLGSLDRLHVRNFNRDNMHDYLRLPRETKRVDSLDDAFPPERFFCFVGSNYRDYGAVGGLSAKGTGPMSDGLVMMRNASVAQAPRAFGHRSHSGPYGIVNSEEGYQNLRRFLFGDHRVDVRMIADEITLPKKVEKEVGDDRERVKAAYNIEASARMRGINVYLNERRVSQESAIRRTYEELVHEGKPVYLFSGYLLKSARPEKPSDTALAFAVELGIQVPVYEVDRRFWFDEHFEGGYLFREAVTLHLRVGRDGPNLRHGLETEHGPHEAPRKIEVQDLGDGGLQYEIALGFKEGAARKPQPGFRGRLQVTVYPWNTA